MAGIPHHHTAEHVAARPRLRGVLHLAMAPVAAIMGIALYAQASGPTRITVGIFAVLLVALYSVSGTYHVAGWTGRVRMLWGRVDTATIALFIAATFTPFAFHSLDGAWRVWSLVAAWGVALLGAAMALSPLTVPRWASTAAYLGGGWLVVVPMARIAGTLPAEGTALIILGGILYTIGAVVYATQKPNPLPQWFGFHEIFHLLVVAASTCHYIAIWRSVL